MTSGPVMSKLILFCVPLMLSSLLQLLFNAADLVVVGRYTGSEALAAVGATTALINIFVNLFIGISMGVNVTAARYFATKNAEGMQETVHTAILTALITGITMLFLGQLLSRWALGLMATPDDVIDLSVLYMRLYFLGMPFFMLYNYGAAILRAVGDTRRPLYYLLLAGCVNVVLNLLLVIVFHLGVAGVAVATVCSQCISCILVLRCLCTARTSYQLSFRKLRICPQQLKLMLQVGLPAGIQSTVINFSNALLQSSVNSFGADAMAGYTATNNLLGFLYVTVNSFTQGCMSFTSQNFGLKKFNRMTKVLIDCLILETVVGGSMGMLCYLLRPQLIGIYTSSRAVIDYGMQIGAITFPVYLLCGYMDCIPGALRGMGHSAIPMILSVIGTVGVRVFWIFVLFPQHRNCFFLFISYPVSWIVTIILQLICYIYVRKKYMKVFV